MDGKQLDRQRSFSAFLARFLSNCFFSVYGHSGVERKGKLFSILNAVFMLVLIRKLGFIRFVRCQRFIAQCMYFPYIQTRSFIKLQRDR